MNRFLHTVVAIAALSLACAANLWAEEPEEGLPRTSPSQDATPVAPPAQSPLEHVAEVLSQLWYQGKPTAFACTIDSGANSSTTTSYHEHPFKRSTGGTFEMPAAWSILNRLGKQTSNVVTGAVTLELRMDGEQLVLEERYPTYSGGVTNVRLLGNGIVFHARGAGSGDVQSIEYFRHPNGTIRGFQRYKNLPSTVVIYDEVPVPAELKPVVQQANKGDGQFGVNGLQVQ